MEIKEEIKRGNKMTDRFIPVIETTLRLRIIKVPEVIREASGIIIKGKKIKSVLFSTDVAAIRNHNADALIAVYPFTPELAVTKAVLDVATVPVFCGVGGGITTGKRSIEIAFHAELFGAAAVVLNTPAKPEIFREMKETVDIPLIATVASINDNYTEKVKAGANIINVSGGKYSPEIVCEIRKNLGDEFPIIATGGSDSDTIKRTIEAGANAISYTPPSNAEIFQEIMKKYREEP